MNFTESAGDSQSLKCQVQGFLMLWFEPSQAIWATLISYSVYNNIINDDNEHSNLKRVKYILTGFILPLALSSCLLLTHQIGHAKYWCWIDITGNENIRKQIYMSIFGFLWMLFFLSFYFIHKVIRFLERHYTNKTEKEVVYKYIRRIRIFPVIQVCCMIPGTLSRFLQLFGLSHPIFDYFNVIFISMQGLLSSIVFGFNPIIKSKIKEMFQTCCNCCYDEEEDKSKDVLNTEMVQQ
jgi:Na+/proline symporter